MIGQQIYLVAVVVSDGYQFVFDEVPSWRKNRTPNPGGSFGIDLNRNFPQGWDSTCSGSTTESSNTFKGPFAASEAETEALIAMSDTLRFEEPLHLLLPLSDLFPCPLLQFAAI